MNGKAPAFFALAAALACASSPARAQSAEGAFGTWNNPANGGHIEISQCGEKLCAKIVAIPDNDGADGPKVDRRNPDETKRDRPIVGLVILEGAYKADEKSWAGSIYNPEDGKTYAVTLTPKNPTDLDVKGCLMSVICRTQTWTRLQ